MALIIAGWALGTAGGYSLGSGDTFLGVSLTIAAFALVAAGNKGEAH